jgi:hypothetical protein
MECPHCLLANPSSALRCDCGYDFQTRSIGPPSLQSQADIDLTLQRTPLPKMWIGFALSVLLLVSEVFDFRERPEQTGTQTHLVFLIFVVATWIYWLWCVHRYHDILTSIPGYRHPISPGQAVARHFIPFYNIYWVFKWPTEVATFVNWRTQSTTMRGWIVGLLVLAGFVMRAVDASIGMAIVFCGGVYISREIRKALAAPPVPESAMARPGAPSALGLY